MSLIEAKKKLLMAQRGGLKPQDVYNTSLWTGNGSARTITTGIDSGFGSLVWIKNRNDASPHTLADTLRGTNSNLATNDTAAADAISRVTAFGSTGYGLSSNGYVNFSGYTYVGWQFRKAPKFFDIVQYTGDGVAGRTIAHSLGVVPGMIVVKQTDTTRNWAVYHTSIGATQYAYLNSTNAFSSSAVRWNNTDPTTSVFTVGTSADTNNSGGTYIAYLFAHDPDPTGIIQCGAFTGLNPGTVNVNLGWRPQYLLLKGASTAGNWQIQDATRGVGNVLSPNLSSSEVGGVTYMSFTSTGFSTTNAGAADFIYMAIREPI